MSAVWVVCFCPCIFLLVRLVGVVEKVFPPRSEEDRNDWALIRITRSGRNEVEHLERSAELCEWAGVKNRSEEGELFERSLALIREAKSSSSF